MGAHGDGAALLGRQRVEAAGSLAHPSDDRARVLDKRGSESGDRDTAWTAFEQGDAQDLLQLAQRPGDHRLGQMQLVGCTRHAAVVSDRDHHRQMTHLEPAVQQPIGIHDHTVTGQSAVRIDDQEPRPHRCARSPARG